MAPRYVFSWPKIVYFWWPVPWGYIPFERVGTQLLFEAISDCYEKRSVIITTNLPFDEWNTIFYDQKLTTAILDRLVHHGLLLMHEGQSYRLQHSKMQ
jgi:DNA replication protein DnaC